MLRFLDAPRIRDVERINALALLPMRYAPPRRRWFSRLLTLFLGRAA